MSHASLQRVDAPLRAAHARERRLLTAAALGLAVFWLAVVALSDLDTPSVLRGAGLLLVVVMLALLAVDAWRPRLRGSTSIDADRGETHLQAARWHAWCLVVGGAGWVALALSALLGDGPIDSAAGGGLLTFLVVLPAPVALLAAVVAVVRPLRVTLAISGVSVRTPWRSRTLGWDDVADAGPARVGSTAMPVQIDPNRGRPLLAGTRHLIVTPTVLATLVLHYRDSAADRSELGTVASQDRIDAARGA